MASLLSTLTLIALLALSLPIIPNSLASNDVITQQCLNTENPETCEACVTSDPNSGTANTPLAVAAIVVSCLRERSSVLGANMSELVKVAADKGVQADLLGCSRGYGQSVRMLDRVVGTYLKTRHYGDANRSIRLTAEIQYTCVEKLKGSNKKFEIPDDMNYSMKVCYELAEASMRIIDRL